MVSFEITLNSIILTPSFGPAITVLNTPTRLEVTHHAGTFEPLTVVNIPQGTYTSASVNVSNPGVTIIDPTTKKTKTLNVLLSSATVVINFNPPLAINGAATSLNFDLNVLNSLTITGSSGAVTPTFTVTMSTVGQESGQHVDSGEIEDFTGAVTAVNGTSFTVSSHNGNMTLTFNTDANTKFEGITGVTQLTIGTIVKVEGVTKPDGSLYAKEVETKIEHETSGDVKEALEIEGLVTKVTGNPATSFDVLPREISAAVGTTPTLGTGVTVNVGTNTKFFFDSKHLDLSGLPFTPTFDATTLIAGQNIEVDTEMPSTTTIDARRVVLKSQTVTGAVSNFTSAGSSASFTLTVPADSAFATLTGKTTVTVFQKSMSELMGITAIANGDTVRVRGLLFVDGTTLKLVARRIGKP